jgi:hypothetical protein
MEQEVLMGIDLVGLLAVFSIFFVPITGLMLILTIRFAFKPLVETLAKALRESGRGVSFEGYPQDPEVSLQIEALREEIRALRAEQEFDRKLLGSATSAPGNGDLSV